MSWFTNTFSGAIGRKLIMSLTGLFLITFLIVHLMGNMALLKTESAAFNEYANFMKTNPAIRVMEIVLFAGFIFHIIYSMILTYQNKKARPVGYKKSNAGENSTWFSRNMILTGILVLVFLVIHLRKFFIPHKIYEPWKNRETLYDEAHFVFQDGLWVAVYVFFMIILALHLIHGFSSAFQTLGARHPKYTPLIRFLGYLFAIIVPGLFAMIPVVIYLMNN